MTEQKQDRNREGQEEVEAQEAKEAQQVHNAAGPEGKEAAGTTSAPVKVKSSGRFSLVLCLLLAGGLAYLGYMLLEQDQALEQLAAGQSELASRQNELAAERSTSASTLEVLQERVGLLQEALDETRGELRAQNEGLAEVRDQITNTRLRLENVDAGSENRIWMLSEVEAMLRLAQQRLVVARDTGTAIALMVASDEILRDINDSSIYPVREALADDLAALRAVPEVDVQGKYVRLSALMDRIGNLQLKNGTEEQLAAARQLEPAAGGEPGMMDEFLDRLSSMVTVRRLDEPLQGMISAEQGYYIRQNIRLLLEQAQLALWRGEPEIYENNINQALGYIDDYFLGDDAEYQSIVSGLQELRDEPITTRIPPASSGLMALRQVIDAYERGANDN